MRGMANMAFLLSETRLRHVPYFTRDPRFLFVIFTNIWLLDLSLEC